jgi:hypothetical protein
LEEIFMITSMGFNRNCSMNSSFHFQNNSTH